MRLSKPFSPIAPGEKDFFAFDFTADVGTAAIVSTSWTCTGPPAAYPTAPDPNPQGHILSSFAATQIFTSSPQDFTGNPGGAQGPAVAMTGAFSVALVGGFLPSQAGAVYQVEATVNLSDGRTLALGADLPVTSE